MESREKRTSWKRWCVMALCCGWLVGWSQDAWAQVDLVVSSFTGLPAALSGGDWTNANICVKNNGTADAQASQLTISLSLDKGITTGVTVLHQSQVPLLKAGQQHCLDVALKLPAVVPPLGYWISGVADTSLQNAETDETNNVTQYKLQNGAKYVDFTVSLSSFSGGNGVKPGDTFLLNVCVYNTGTIDASGPIKVGLFFAHTTGISPTFSHKITEYALTLKASGQDCRTLNETYPPNMQPAMRGTIGIIADYDKQFQDPNLSDNTRTIPITTTTFPRPDIELVSLTGPSQAVAVGGQSSATICLKNNGSDAGPFVVSLHYSRQNLVSPKDLLLKETPITGLKANATTCPQVTFAVPAKVQPGASANFLGAIADFKNQLFESDEINNTKATAFSVQAFTRPDLVVTSLTQVPATTGQGSSFQVNACIKNNGTADAFQPNVGIYFSDIPIQNTNAVKVGQASLASPLKAGATACANVTVTLLPQFPAGMIRLAAIADGDDIVSETNENNNVGSNVQLRILGPDLELSRFEIIPTGANFSYWGDPLKVRLCIKNISTRADLTKPFRVGIYDSANPAIFTNDRLVHTVSYGQADLSKFTKGGPGDCRDITLSFPRHAAAGRRFLGAFIDDEFKLREDGPGINSSDPGIPYYIVSKVKPNLVITSMEPPPIIRVGNAAPIKVCYANYGIAPSQATSVAINLYYLQNSNDFFSTPFHQIPNLAIPAPNTIACTTATVQLPTGAQPGKRWIGGRIDATTQLAEDNEGDNDTIGPVTVEVFIDKDNDGVPQDADCDDNDKDVYPAYKAASAAPELCDGKDNNCDNKIDEGFAMLGMACTPGQGECQRSGKHVCSQDGKGTTCDVTAGQPSTEVCDGKDNDCDGAIDNGTTCPQGTLCMGGRCLGMGEPEPSEEPAAEPDQEPSAELSAEPSQEKAPEPTSEPGQEPQAEPVADAGPEPAPDQITTEPPSTPEPSPEPTADAAPPAGCGCHSNNGLPSGFVLVALLLFALVRRSPRKRTNHW